jgi:hypothetical protein
MLHDGHDSRIKSLVPSVVISTVKPPSLYSIGHGHATESEGRHAAARRAGAELRGKDAAAAAAAIVARRGPPEWSPSRCIRRR